MDVGKKRVGRKLLVASLGVATMTYGACGTSKPLPSPDAAVVAAPDAGAETTPETSPDAGDNNPFGHTDAADAPERQFVGNLIP